MAGKIKHETIDAILLEKVVRGKNAAEVADLVGCSKASVTNVFRVYKAIMYDNWNDLIACAVSGISSIDMVKYIADGCVKDVPECVIEAFRQRNQELRTKEPSRIIEEHYGLEDNTGLYLVKILQALTEMNSLLREMIPCQS